MKEHLGLPEFSYAPGRQTCGDVVRIIRGEKVPYGVRSHKAITEMNGALGITVQQAAAMEGGIYYGWDSYHADPEQYTYAGDYIGPAEKEIEHG